MRASYLQWHADSERRYKAGQRQKQCKCCGLWFWRHELPANRKDGNDKRTMGQANKRNRGTV